MNSAKHTLMFGVIGKTCDACHNAVTPALSFYGVSNLTTRPGDHNSGSKKTSDCSSCHNPSSWDGGAQTRAAAKATTRGVVTAVVAAPNGAARPNAAEASNAVPAAIGSSRGIGTRGMVSAAVSHVGVTAGCVSCHNGVLASGKGSNHITGSNLCQNCHITAGWLPARFDHQGVTAACASCHNGAITAGKSISHIPTAQDCGACHGTIAWTAVTFRHLNLTASCSSCHNGVNAVGRQPNHPLSSQDCATCHNTQSWQAFATKAPLKPLLGKPRTP